MGKSLHYVGEEIEFQGHKPKYSAQVNDLITAILLCPKYLCMVFSMCCIVTDTDCSQLFMLLLCPSQGYGGISTIAARLQSWGRGTRTGLRTKNLNTVKRMICPHKLSIKEENLI